MCADVTMRFGESFEAMLPFAAILSNTVIGQRDELSLPPVHE